MKTKLPFLILLAAGSALAQAQVTFTGYSELTQGVSATLVGDYAGSVVPILAAGEAGFSADDIYNYRVVHGATSASASFTYYFSLETGNIPVKVVGLTGLFDGKLVYGGGGLATNYTVDLFGKVSIYEYDDADNSGKFEPNETSYLGATSAPIPLASLAANGVALYDTSGASLPDPYVLGANTDYFVAVQSYWNLAGTAAVNDPSVVITVEHVTPLFSGHSATFDYQTVPEPTTAALLGVSAVALLRRRRAA